VYAHRGIRSYVVKSDKTMISYFVKSSQFDYEWDPVKSDYDNHLESAIRLACEWDISRNAVVPSMAIAIEARLRKGYDDMQGSIDLLDIFTHPGLEDLPVPAAMPYWLVRAYKDKACGMVHRERGGLRLVRFRSPATNGIQYKFFLRQRPGYCTHQWDYVALYRLSRSYDENGVYTGFKFKHDWATAKETEFVSQCPCDCACDLDLPHLRYDDDRLGHFEMYYLHVSLGGGEFFRFTVPRVDLALLHKVMKDNKMRLPRKFKIADWSGVPITNVELYALHANNMVWVSVIPFVNRGVFSARDDFDPRADVVHVGME